jgi:peptide/nickel transport system substrate-binding protein
MMRKLWMVVSLLVVLAMLASCAPAATPAPAETEAAPTAAPTTPPEPEATSAPPPPEVPQVLNINMRVPPTDMDPQRESAASGKMVLGNVFDRLVSLDSNMDIAPELAKDWDISDDGLTYTFYLEEGVTFHDGTPFNAEAVKFTFDRLIDPETGSTFFGDYGMIDSVAVIDDSTVEFTLGYPYGPFLRRLAMTEAGILSPTAVEELGPDFSSHPVGAGPFIVDEWVSGERLVLVRNENYWQELPKLERVNFSFIAEEQARIAALLAGDTDFDTVIPPSLLSMVEADPNMVIERGPSLFPEWVAFNVEKAPFDDVLVRRAAGYAMDIDTIIEEIYLGVGVRATQPVAPGVFGFDDTIEPIPYDPEMARDLLAQAGWEDTDGDGVVDKDGQKFSAEFLIMAVTEIQRMAEAMQAYLADVGMEVDIVVEDWGAFLADCGAGNMNMFVLGQENPMGDADASLGYLFTCENVDVSNYTRYCNPEFDRLVDEERRETDPEVREELLSEAINLVVDDAVQVPTFVRETLMAHNQKVKGFVLHPSDTYFVLKGLHIEE